MLVTERAPAKINLGLHVIGRRADGYHELDSVVAFADVCDVLTLEPSPSLGLDVSGPFASALGRSSDNSVLQAWRMLATSTPLQSVKFHLEKMLPVAAGMGGGSADAAAAIRGLIKLFNLKIPSQDLHALALHLGADVPVCLASLTARMQGVGEILTPFELQAPDSIVLVNPGVPSLTAKVFEVLGLKPGQQFALPMKTFDVWRNDLTIPAIKCVPEIASVIEVLKSQPDMTSVGMSGSGATCFGLCENHESADAAAAAIRYQHPNWWVVATSLL